MNKAPGREMAGPSGRRWRWLLGGLIGGALVVAGALLSAGGAALEQPIRFNHKVHVKQAKCQACHTTVMKGPVAGAPKLADCLDCHEGSQATTPEGKREEAKLDAYAKTKSGIPWKRVWRLPSHVFFSHRTHVAVAKVECQTCHGPMQTLERPPTYPLKTLTMNDCLGCHERWRWPDEPRAADAQGKGTQQETVAAVRRVSTDCNACHR